jgi:hypothetical protein
MENNSARQWNRSKRKGGAATAAAGLCLLGCILLVGCRTGGATTSASATAVKLKKENHFFQALQNQTIHYQTLSARMQIAFVTPPDKEFSSRGHLKIQYNRRIQLSIQPFLGIEVYRVELTPDSLKFIDRINKRYLLDSLAPFKAKMPVDFNFYHLQALLTNQVFVPSEANLPEHAYKYFQWTRTATGYRLQAKAPSLQYLFVADAEEKLCAANMTLPALQRTLCWDYTDFRRFDAALFPMNIHIHPDKESPQQISLSIHFTRIDKDVPVEMNFPIPSDYIRMNTTEMIHLFTEPR